MSREPFQGPPTGLGSGRGVQAGCGAVIGAFIGVAELVVIGIGTNSSLGFALAVGVPAVLFGLLAWRYGDRFWESYFGGG
jgi:hypothetical protein